MIGQFLGISQPCNTTGGNLVVNGDFETCSGCALPTLATGDAAHATFTTDYSPVSCSGGSKIGGGKYAITNDASQCFKNWVDGSITAHGGNYAMLVDANASTRLWCQNVNVVNGSTYRFSAWYQNAVDPGSSPGELPAVSLTVDGVEIDPGNYAVMDHPPNWELNQCMWQATSTGTVEICVELVSDGTLGGNDGLIDDLEFIEVTGGGCTAGNCTYTGTLPVDLLMFTAVDIAGNAELNWTTASEEDFSHFVVLKSDDGKEYYEIGLIKSKGSGDGDLSNYEFIDYNFERTSYYQLKMVDDNGFTEYSDIKSLQKDISIQLIQNENGSIEIDFHSEQDMGAQVSLYTILGQELLNTDFTIQKGNSKYMIDPAYTRRSCIVKVIGRSGEILFTEMIIY
jgi:hypothetical protein